MRHSLDRFYAGDSKSEPRGAQPLSAGGAHEVAALRALLMRALRRQPGDVRLTLRAMEAAVRATLAEHRLGGGDRERLSENFRAALDSLGSQILPPDD